MINKKTTSLLNLGCGINKIFYSDLYVFFSFHKNVITFRFIISGKYVINIYVSRECVMFILFLYFTCVNFASA